MKRILQTKLLVIATLLIGCVTINVYFPAAAAEKAADKILDDIYGQQPAGAPPAPAPQKPMSDTQGSLEHGTYVLLGRMMDFVVPVAYAEADLDISSPAVQSLTQSLQSRQGQLAPHFGTGAVGLTNDGQVAVRDAGLIPLAERNNVKKLVADQNAEYIQLYKEIATANGHPEWAGDIQKTFGQRASSKAQAGWYYQDKSGNWVQK